MYGRTVSIPCLYLHGNDTGGAEFGSPCAVECIAPCGTYVIC